MRQAAKQRRGKPIKNVRRTAPKARKGVVRRRRARKPSLHSAVRSAIAPAIKRVRAIKRQLHVGHARAAVVSACILVIALAGFAGTAGLFDSANAITTPNQNDATIEAMIDAELAANREAQSALNLPLAIAKPPATRAVAKPAAVAPAPTPIPTAAAPVVAPAAAVPVTTSRPAKIRQTPRTLAPRSSRSHRRYAALAPNDSGAPTVGGLGSTTLVAEARRYIGGNPTGRGSLWCGAFMDMVLKRTGHRGGGNLALGYLKYGSRVATPQIGAIAVMGRRGGGHVGVVSGFDANGNPIVISGNHNHRVAEATYPRSRIIAYVVP